MPSRVVFVYGTRPEVIKIAPVVDDLRELGVDPVLICTGQHTSLLEGTPAKTVLKDSINLGMPSEGSIFGWVYHVQEVLTWEYFNGDDHVVVQGDTMSAFAGAAAAVSSAVAMGGCTLHHVEAGVRSFASEPWPEEDIRKAISGMASHHYCATAQNAINLQKEGVTENVHIAGNPGITSLLDLGITVCDVSSPPTILVTLHRRELRESAEFPEIVDSLFRAMHRHPAIHFLWPVHPALNDLLLRSGRPNNLEVVAPLSYTDFVVRLSTSLGLLTDSGGAVEEAATLGIPTVIFRRYNDRPEAEEAGIATRITPTRASPSVAIHTLAEKLLPREPHAIYGDLKSASRIASHIKEALL